MSISADRITPSALRLAALLLAVIPAASAQTPAPATVQAPAAAPARRPAGAAPAVAPAAKPGTPPAAVPAAAPPLPDPPIPTQHATQAGMGRCTPAIDQLSRMALNVPYNAQSTWNQAAPADHVFQSVAGVKNPKNNPAGGMVAIIAAPVSNETCDAVAMEVYPLAGSCADVQKLLTKGGEIETALEDIRVITDAQKRRLFLMPGAANTCVAISINSFYGNK